MHANSGLPACHVPIQPHRAPRAPCVASCVASPTCVQGRSAPDNQGPGCTWPGRYTHAAHPSTLSRQAQAGDGVRGREQPEQARAPSPCGRVGREDEKGEGGKTRCTPEVSIPSSRAPHRASNPLPSLTCLSPDDALVEPPWEESPRLKPTHK